MRQEWNGLVEKTDWWEGREFFQAAVEKWSSLISSLY
jgi:hypothetical protein